MKNNLPKEGWCVKNDGSQLFKDMVLPHFKEGTDDIKGHFYGETWKGERFKYVTADAFYGGIKLDIDQFIELSKPTEEFKRVFTKEDYEGAWSNKQVSGLIDKLLTTKYYMEGGSVEIGNCGEIVKQTITWRTNMIERFKIDYGLAQEDSIKPKPESGKWYHWADIIVCVDDKSGGDFLLCYNVYGKIMTLSVSELREEATEEQVLESLVIEAEKLGHFYHLYKLDINGCLIGIIMAPEAYNNQKRVILMEKGGLV